MLGISNHQVVQSAVVKIKAIQILFSRVSQYPVLPFRSIMNVAADLEPDNFELIEDRRYRGVQLLFESPESYYLLFSVRYVYLRDLDGELVPLLA